VHLFAILEEIPKRTYLGEMELMVLFPVVRLGEDAYGVPISNELVLLAGRELALGSIYAALDRLERKAFVTSSLGDPTPERGGRAKRYFRATPMGLQALRTARTALINLWNGIAQLEGAHMNHGATNPPEKAIWFLQHACPGDNEALAGDLIERFRQGRCACPLG
jgi:PadR family transcriptional regulator PadR